MVVASSIASAPARAMAIAALGGFGPATASAVLAVGAAKSVEAMGDLVHGLLQRRLVNLGGAVLLARVRRSGLLVGAVVGSTGLSRLADDRAGAFLALREELVDVHQLALKHLVLRAQVLQQRHLVVEPMRQQVVEPFQSGAHIA